MRDNIIFLSRNTYKLILRIHISIRRLCRLIETVIGKYEAARFYDDLRRNLAFKTGLIPGLTRIESVSKWAWDRNKTETFAQTLDEWNRRLLLLSKPAETGQAIKTGKKTKTKNRPTKAEMKVREQEVMGAVDKYVYTYGHKPTAGEIAHKTPYTVPQIRATSTYDDGKIKKQTGKTKKTFDTVGDSVAPSEFFSEGSELGSRTGRQNKADEAMLDKLIDESSADVTKDEEQHKRYLQNKKKIKREES